MSDTITNIIKPNPIKAGRVLLLLVLTPIIAPAYLIGILTALLHIAAYCGYKNTDKYFMVGLGFESNEQMLERMVKERF